MSDLGVPPLRRGVRPMLCDHVWSYDPVVRDFGTYGIQARSCAVCGLRQESDPWAPATWRDLGVGPLPGGLIPQPTRREMGVDAPDFGRPLGGRTDLEGTARPGEEGP